MSFESLRELLELNEKRALLEIELTSGNIHQFAGKDIKHLTDRDEFKKIEQLDHEYAKKLVAAWIGDKSDFERSSGKVTNFLFPLMLSSQAIANKAPKLKTPDTEKSIKLLLQLHKISFVDSKHARQDNSVWKSEKWAREWLEVNEIDLEQLREEMEIYRDLSL